MSHNGVGVGMATHHNLKEEPGIGMDNWAELGLADDPLEHHLLVEDLGGGAVPVRLLEGLDRAQLCVILHTFSRLYPRPYPRGGR